MELHAPNQEKSEKIEIKSEDWPQLDVTALSQYKNLIYLNLSMNKIGIIRGAIDCPLLSSLRVSDNQIRDVPQALL